MFRLINFLLFFLISIEIQAGTINEKASDKKHVDYGSEHECVLKIEGNYQDNQTFFASAVAIKPKWVITAAHVVQGYKEVQIEVKSKKIKVTEVIIHKDFEKNNFGYYDIALGRCEQDMKLKHYPALYENNDEVGKISGICGVGMTGDFVKGAHFYDGKKRAGSNYIDYAERTVLVCSPSRRGQPKYTNLEFLICSGDSGGGLFIDGKLAGINSSVMAPKGKQPNSTYGTESCHTRVSLMLDWIRKYSED
jgi:secreted trypsin-like serine protease